MEEPTQEVAAERVDVEAAEEQDDAARLASLEALLTHLEAELERDDPSAEGNRSS